LHKTDLEQLARAGIREATLLLNHGEFPGAFYLAGYAVECALKACIAKLTNQHDFPPRVKFVQDCYTHHIDTLVKTAGLTVDRDAATAADPDLEANGSVVKDWNESSRYEMKTQAEAKALIQAITDQDHGVFPWIVTHW
jgi:HEPN domain-containing protein